MAGELLRYKDETLARNLKSQLCLPENTQKHQELRPGAITRSNSANRTSIRCDARSSFRIQ